jgi:hypothetical protein
MKKEHVEFDLLADIAKLLRRHGPEAFEALAKSLSSPEWAARLVAILNASAKVARDVGTNGGHQAHRRELRSSLVELETNDPARSATLLKVYDALMSKSILPMLRDVHSFALEQGFPPLKASTRPKAVEELLRAMMSIPYEQVQRIISSMPVTSVRDDRSLEGWTRLILDENNRAKKPAS